MRYEQDRGLRVSSSPLERLALPGQLVWHHRQLDTPGNRVLSFIDIAAPEDIPPEALAAALRELLQLAGIQQSFVPWGSRVGFSLGLEAARVSGWRQEIRGLVTHLFDVMP